MQIKNKKGDVLKELVSNSLRDAYLRCSDLRGAYLRDDYLYNSDLVGSDLRDAYLRCADSGLH